MSNQNAGLGTAMVTDVAIRVTKSFFKVGMVLMVIVLGIVTFLVGAAFVYWWDIWGKYAAVVVVLYAIYRIWKWLFRDPATQVTEFLAPKISYNALFYFRRYVNDLDNASELEEVAGPYLNWEQIADFDWRNDLLSKGIEPWKAAVRFMQRDPERFARFAANFDNKVWEKDALSLTF